jgi:hypothetical protein
MLNRRKTKFFLGREELLPFDKNQAQLSAFSNTHNPPFSGDNSRRLNYENF